MADGKVKIETSVDQKGIETGLQEAEKKIQDFGKAAQTEAQQVDKSLSSMGQNVGSDLQTGMDHAQDVMEQGADQITDAVADVDQSLDGMGDGVSKAPLTEEMQRASESVSESAEKIAKSAEEADKSTEEFGKNTDTSGMRKSFREAEREVGSSCTGIDVAVSKATQIIAGFVSAAAITAAAKQATQYVIEVGSAFEASMSEVQAISGATSAELEKMSAKAKQLGSTSRFSATEVSQAFKYMSLAGWDVSQSISAVDGVIQLAAASGMDLAAASDMVTDYLSAFGMEASQATYMADMLAYAQSHSNTTAEQLGEAYKNCAANMNASGQDIETTTAMLEALANQGSKSSEAGTKVSAIMRDITAKMDEGKIAIGDTTVAVMDANGNFRDMTDIIKDVDTAAQGMGDAEKAAALASTFTSDSISGLNMILNEGVDKITGYEEELRNSSGAAADMADTMQNNLQGKITAAGSALEGLGIAAYDYISGPAGTVVDMATGMFKGLTDLISPAKSEMEQYIDDINIALDTVDASLKTAEKTMDAATVDTNKLETYKKTLLDLTGVENKNEYQKYQLKRIVAELSDTIPELAAAYDEETGSISLTNQEIEKLLDNQKAQVMQASAQEALEKVYQAQFDATLALTQAQDGLTEAQKRWNERVDEALGPNHQVVESLQDYYDITGNTDDELEDLALSIESLSAEVDRAQEAQDKANETAEEYEKTVDRVKESLIGETDAQKDEKDAVEDGTDAKKGAITANQDLLTSEIEYAGQTYKTTGEIAEKFQTLQEAYKSAYESAQGSIMGQLSLYSEWSAGAEITAAKALENFASCVNGMTNYAANLDALTQGVTDVSTNSVVALDTGFVQYLRDLGPQSASLVAAIAQEINAGNVQYIQDLNDNWDKYYNVSVEIAEENAEAETGFKEFAGDLVSTAQQTAQDATQATADGIDSKRPQVDESLQSIAYDFMEKLTIPDETTKIGSDNIAGYITGAESKQPEVSTTAISLAGATEDGLTDTDATTQIGSGNIVGYITGAEAQKENAENAAVDISNATDDGLGSADTAKTAGKLMASLLGVLVAGTTLAWIDGVAVSNAMNLGLGSADTAGTASKLSDKYVRRTREYRGEAESAGRYLAEGFAAGIYAGQGSVAVAAASSARAALAAFRATAQIHSPSAAAKADALFVPEGWAGGIEDGQEQVEKAAEETAEVTLDSFKDLLLPEVDTSLVIDQLTQQPQILAQTITESGTESVVRSIPEQSESASPEPDYEKVGEAVARALENTEVRLDGKKVGKVMTGRINAGLQEYAQMNQRGVM